MNRTLALRQTPDSLLWLRAGWIFLALLALVCGTRRAKAADTPKPPVPVLIELFTSEGCSSCPPADDLLAQLDRQPLPGIRAIVLSEHVTYWNQLGWRDPFSSDAMTERQRDYSAHFNLADVYTPQAVIDGAAQVVGSNADKLSRAIQQAAGAPKSELTIGSAQWTNGSVQFTVHGSANPNANVYAALAEDSEQTHVLRGENGGRTLHHVAVVRALEPLGKASADSRSPLAGKELQLRLPLSKDVNDSGPLRLVVFTADRHTGHVTAIAEQTVPRS